MNSIATRLPIGGFVASLIIAVSAGAREQVAVDLQNGETRTLAWESEVTDRHLINPGGYFARERPAHRLVESVTLTNTGVSPIANPVLRVNDRPQVTVNDAADFLGVGPDSSLREIFDAWREMRHHGSTRLAENRRALDVIRAFGVTLCDDDAHALSGLISELGGRSWRVPLSGHIVHVFELGEELGVIDGDHECVFLDLDGEGLIGPEEILADPLPVIRTRIYGRQMPFQPGGGWQNAARFQNRPLREIEPPDAAAAQVDWELLPGESIRFFRDGDVLPTRLALTKNQADAPAVREAAVTVEIALDAELRQGRRMGVPFPAVAIRESDGSLRELVEHGDAPRYEISIPDDLESGAAVICQATHRMVPLPKERENSLRLESPTPDARMRVVFAVNRLELPAPAPPRLTVEGWHLTGSPVFAVEAPGADTIWWQVAEDKAFEDVLPNFDRVETIKSRVRVATPVETTFFQDDSSYSLRAKVRKNGVWSDWSDVVTFESTKPAPPTDVSAEKTPEGSVLVRWEATPGEVWIFGSDRWDAVPTLHSTILPTEIVNARITESKENDTLLARSPGESGSIEIPNVPFIRLIRVEPEGFSNPSRLITVEGSAPSRALRNDHEPPDRDVARIQ